MDVSALALSERCRAGTMRPSKTLVMMEKNRKERRFPQGGCRRRVIARPEIRTQGVQYNTNLVPGTAAVGIHGSVVAPNHMRGRQSSS